MTNMKKIFTTENLIVAAVIFLAIFFAKFPTLYNWLNTPKSYWYPKQTSWYDAWDTNFQVSDIRWGQRKGILAQNTYTTIPHKGEFIYQFYTFLGVANRILHMDPFVLYHLATVTTGIIILLICYLIARLFFTDQMERISAFIIFALGGGFGFLPGMNSISADTGVAGFNLVNALERGSDAVSTILLLVSFIFIFRFINTYDKKYILWTVVSAFVSITFHPPFAALFIVVGSIAAYWEWVKSKKFYFTAFPIILLILFVIYYFLVLSSLLTNPVFAGIVKQNLFDVDSFSLLSGFGLLSIFIAYAFIFSRNTSDEFIFAKIIFLAQLTFLFLPVGYHLYFVKGLQIWGVILAFYGLREMITNKGWNLRITTLIVGVSLISRLYIFNALMHASPANSFFFLQQDEGKALEYISTLPADSGTLSLYRIGNYIPAFSDTRVYYGHKFQTPGGNQTLRQAELFYTAMSQKERAQFLQKNNIKYIYYGLQEADVRDEQKLEIKNPFPEYPIIYQNDSAIIYSATPSSEKIK